MFKIPDWGDDVPNLKANFAKKSKNTNKQPATTPVKTSNVKQTENSSKTPQNGIKKKKRKNKNQTKNNLEKQFAPNVKAKGPSFVSTKINGAVKRNKFQKKDSMENKNTSFNDGNNRKDNKNNKNKLNKKNKKGQGDTTESHKISVGTNDNQNVPKKGKKRKKPSKNDTQNLDINDVNEIEAKKKKIDNNFKIDEQEDLLFGHNNKSQNKSKKKKDSVEVKRTTKKERLKQLLETQMQRTPIKTSGNSLRERMQERLKAAQFRYINEKLYTSSGSDAQQLFQGDPTAFQTYHAGYQLQVKKWPVNPLDVIIKRIQKMPKTSTIADMGCGEGALSKRIPHTVRSFDLVATSPGIEVCDIAHTPLLSESMDVAVYCLALMGTDLTQYLVEANRVLKVGGHLLIAEVESRFNKVEDFTKDVERLGFKLKNLDKTHQVFFFMEFTKSRDPPVKKSKLPVLTLKPCLYKRR